MKTILCLPRIYDFETELVYDITAKNKWYRIPGFLVTKDYYSNHDRKWYHPGETILVFQNQLVNVIDYFEPDSPLYDKKLKNASQYLYDVLVLRISHPSQRPKCPVCGKPCKFVGLMGGYYKYCSLDCCYADEKRSETISNKISNLWNDSDSIYRKDNWISHVMHDYWQDPSSAYNSEEWRRRRSEAQSYSNHIRWADPNDTFNSPEFRKGISERMKFIWDHSELYPEAHASWNKMFSGRIDDRSEIEVNSLHPRYIQGYHLSPKTGWIHKFQSSYELEFYLNLDNNPNVLNYITAYGPIMYYNPEDGRYHRYFPDVLVINKDRSIDLIEIKPKDKLGDYENILKFNAGKKYALKQGWNWMVLIEDDIFKTRETFIPNKFIV